MKRFFYYIPALIFLFHLLSCKKFIEIDTPKNKLVTATVFQSDATANSAMLAIYSSMFTQSANPYVMSLFPGLSADELKTYAIIPNYQQLYENLILPIDAASSSIWTSGFNCIYQANAVIEGCNSSTQLSLSVKKQLIGESLFLRAFWNFYLVNDFGDIPLVLTSDYTQNYALARSPSNKVYEQIVSDLKAAQNNLGTEYVAADGITVSEERVRINKNVATALLARVYLYTGKYTDAVLQSTVLISNNAVYDTTDLTSVFLKNSREAIWQIMTPSSSTLNALEGSYFKLAAKPGVSVTRSSTISESLLNAFETGDHRKDAWIGKYTDVKVTPNKDYYFPYKYKNSGDGTVTEYSMIMRIAEQYLIRAEANTQNGDLDGGIADIDVIRKRAGLPLISIVNPNISKDDLLAAVLKERRLELFTEWGHRWFDLKRTGEINTVMPLEAVSKGSTWNSTKLLYPIPQTEINNDPNLKQNEGYH
jgi:2-C-methyl-D-erythritol 4-phosphate cytidylyltransferase